MILLTNWKATRFSRRSILHALNCFTIAGFSSREDNWTSEQHR